MDASTLQASVASDSSPDHSPDNMDTDLTVSLTSGDNHSIRSHSLSPAPTTEMSSYPPNRGPNDLMNSAQSDRPQRSDTMQGPPGSTWRYEETAGNAQTNSYRGQEYDRDVPMMANQYTTARPRGNSYMGGENSVPLSMVCPGPVWPTDDQLNTAYAYGIRREDGSITRLLVADEIANPNVPMRQGSEGLIILPAPRLSSPNRRMGGESMVPGEVVTGLPPMNRIPRHGLPLHAGLDTQSQIDTIVAQSSSVSPPVRRREKIYCDKWIHEGVCAFTQMGCKYRHDMPQDKATQLSLGLNHGVPNWYRRAYAVNIHPESPPALASPPNNGNRTEGPWRRIEGGQQHSEEHGLPSRPRAASRSSYGPIGPPALSANPYSTPTKREEKVAEDEEEEDGEAITWKGRRN